MNIARILYPVKVLGPGNRIGIWVCGCNKKCSGCSNIELWKPQQKYEITILRLKNIIENIASKQKIDGFTITGGEPMDQAKELAELIVYLKKMNKDILVYSGYLFRELQKSKSDYIKKILASIAVLIDGEYIEEKNNNSSLKGSYNQQINILDFQYKDYYENYLKTTHNQIQNFTTTDGIISVGIHKKNFASEIAKRINNNKRSGYNG
jgi:anaerobic ribonucleoside-triphosphate reductase activating protein